MLFFTCLFLAADVFKIYSLSDVSTCGFLTSCLFSAGCVKNDSLSDVDFIYSLQDVVDSPRDVLKEKKEKRIKKVDSLSDVDFICS